MRTISFIVNIAAGAYASTSAISKIHAFAANHKEIVSEILFTPGPGTATHLAENSGGSIVVAVGGDGTINEVAQGILGSGRALGVVPCGSGNDYVKAIGIPADVDSALEIISRGRSRAVDHGMIAAGSSFDDLGSKAGRIFVNIAGVGFDASVAARTRRMRLLRGRLLYVASVLRTIPSFKAPELVIDQDGNRTTRRELLVAIGNGHCAGGGFLLNPDAKIDDGLLDICRISERSIPGILTVMPKAMKGRHGAVHGVVMSRARSIAIRTDDSVAVHADGEVISEGAKAVSVSIVPGGLSVVC